jgi:hypothetical protein
MSLSPLRPLIMSLRVSQEENAQRLDFTTSVAYKSFRVHLLRPWHRLDGLPGSSAP